MRSRVGWRPVIACAVATFTVGIVCVVGAAVAGCSLLLGLDGAVAQDLPTIDAGDDSQPADEGGDDGDSPADTDLDGDSRADLGPDGQPG